jgi:hypothetical protein
MGHAVRLAIIIIFHFDVILSLNVIYFSLHCIEVAWTEPLQIFRLPAIRVCICFSLRLFLKIYSIAMKFIDLNENNNVHLRLYISKINIIVDIQYHSDRTCSLLRKWITKKTFSQKHIDRGIAFSVHCGILSTEA